MIDVIDVLDVGILFVFSSITSITSIPPIPDYHSLIFRHKGVPAKTDWTWLDKYRVMKTLAKKKKKLGRTGQNGRPAVRSSGLAQLIHYSSVQSVYRSIGL